MEIRIELRPMMATQHTVLGVVEKPLGQSMIMAATGKNDRLVHMGYICDAPGSPFNGLHGFRKLPQAIKEAVVAAVMKARDETATPKVTEPPDPDALTPAEIEEALDE